jgi:hypothetical protein
MRRFERTKDIAVQPARIAEGRQGNTGAFSIS